MSDMAWDIILTLCALFLAGVILVGVFASGVLT